MLTVRDVMTRNVVSVQPGTPLKEVARTLVENGISGVPVVDAEGHVLGIVSEADFLVKQQTPEAIRHRPLARILGESRATRAQLAKVRAATAGEAMTSPAVTIEPGRRISEAAAMMTSRGVNRLPVVESGRLVGIVTRADLVRAYVRSDEQLDRAIREDVFRRILWLNPDQFEIVVADGVATIRGQVDRRSTAEMIDRIVAIVPGVIAVRTDVSWAIDDSRIEPPVRDPVFPFSP
ncbi:MAG TPA: CBS domain-containing protein [Candidatus Limnocylindrales bacterium]|jgi:CBS domain-containing protein|nr:CBS domain-containing protein [Candidatus Limnocylindrales bacterium]